MLKDFITTELKNNFHHSPTKEQEELIENLADFVVAPTCNILLIKGYAGTGKTSLVSALVQTLDKLKTDCVLLAPTGRAAKVLSAYSQKPAYTIHKKIYRPKSSGGTATFVLDSNKHSPAIFIVDEASMIANYSADNKVFGSGKLLDDLIEYIFTGKFCKLILLGDPAQLPPVGLTESPALDKLLLENYGLSVQETNLTEVIRQSKESGILHNATEIRNNISLNGLNVQQPKFTINKYTDIQRIGGSDLIEAISNSYDKYGLENTIIINRTNKNSNKYNEGIRNQILWRDQEIAPGDRLMIVKNNYFWLRDIKEADFIANGDIVEVRKILKYNDLYGHRFADLEIEMPDYNNIRVEVKVFLDTLMLDSASLSSEQNSQLFYKVAEDYADIPSKYKQYQKVKENPFFNALQIKFAYSVTCHKAQGGQWKSVFVDQGYFKDDMLNLEYLRWLYTAVTRSTEKLYLVNFKDEFFA